MQKIYTLLCMMVLTLLSACYTNVFDETDGEPAEMTGENDLTTVTPQVTINGSAVTDASLQLVTIADEMKLDQNDKVETVLNDLPQLFYVEDESDNIRLIARTPLKAGGTVEVNEETTAMALVTFNALFANLNNTDYVEATNIVKATDAWPALLERVTEAVADGRDVTDPENVEMLIAINNVLEEICYSIPERSEEEPIFTRATEVTGIVADPIYVSKSGNQVSVRNTGLVPTYECQVYHGGNRVGQPVLIRSHASYGLMDLWKSVGDVKYGPRTDFNLTEQGEYQFYFDRLTDRAINDFSRRLWSDVISMIGLYDAGLVQDAGLSLVTKISNWIVNPDTDWTDIVKDLSQLSISIGATMKWENAMKLFGRVNLVYNVLKGFSNEMVRCALGFTAPPSVEFCLCSYGGDVTSCTESLIYKVKGDEQTGFGGQRLNLPLVVRARVFADDGTEIERSTYQKVKFEVVKGGGYVSRRIVGTSGESNEAQTYWTLGTSGEQMVKAVVVDMVTGVEVSEPVYFTATLREDADLLVRLDWAKLSGNTDIDLHVTDPYGAEVYYNNPWVASGGWLDWDDVVGPGPEHISWSHAPAGKYLIQVHYFGSESQVITSYTVNINAMGKTYGPFSGSIAYHQLVTIGTLDLPTGTFTRSTNRASATFDEMFKVQDDVMFPAKK